MVLHSSQTSQAQKLHKIGVCEDCKFVIIILKNNKVFLVEVGNVSKKTENGHCV